MRMDTNTAQLAQINAHKTAIRRFRGISAPMKVLLAHNMIGDSTVNCTVLDYGCGRGEDADQLKFQKYDPYFFPDIPKDKFDIVVCNYVLNVLPVEEQDVLVSKILAKVKAGGKAFITVRRDVKKEGFTPKGTFQRNVTLDCPVFFEKKGQYCIYEIAN